jgi:hypothetical protein
MSKPRKHIWQYTIHARQQRNNPSRDPAPSIKECFLSRICLTINIVLIIHGRMLNSKLQVYEHCCRIQRKKNGVWEPMPELTITSPYVHSIVDSNTFTMGNPKSTPYARVDFIPQSGTLDLTSDQDVELVEQTYVNND